MEPNVETQQWNLMCVCVDVCVRVCGCVSQTLHLSLLNVGQYSYIFPVAYKDEDEGKSRKGEASLFI